jgi:type II secretory pathway predicted ATPase ExeA
MYLELFGLSEMPFRLTPDPHFLFASKQHARAKAYMESTIWLADGFVVITGEIGSGKTTLIESFLAELPENVVLAQISQTQLSPVEFLQALLVEFGFKPFRQKKIELLATLRDYMIEQYASGKTLLLVIDEAQNLSRRVLEEVRLLSGIEAQKDKLLRIILAGQPELAQKLESPSLEQLRQRVRLMFHLSALSKRETKEYVEHRLQVAGAQGRQIIKEDAFDLIFRYTGGIPRLTNILCDTAMLCAFADETNLVTVELVKAAVDELQWVPYSERRPDGAQATGGFLHPVSHLARFDVLFRDQVVADFPVALGRSIIGRTTDNDLQIRSKFISRHHAQIITTAQTSVIEDLNSTNGIFVRSRRVKHHDLVEGDVVQIGEHKLLYHDLRGQHLRTAELEELEELEELDEDAEEDDELDDEDEDEDESAGEADNPGAPRAE